MLRSAAKNFESVTVVTDPADYERVAAELEANRAIPRWRCGSNWRAKVFATTSRYDGLDHHGTGAAYELAASWKSRRSAILPERVHLALRRKQELRYGENPHQAAALYVPAGRAPEGLAAAKQLQGKELSYNNYVDLEAARSLVAEFERPAAVIIKHNNPCGAAEQKTLAGCLLESVCVRPRFGVWRGAGVQSHCGRGDRGSKWRSCSSNASLRRDLRTGAGNFRGEEKSAAAGAAARRT